MPKLFIKSAVSAGAIFLGIIATVPAHAVIFDFSVTSTDVTGDLASGTFTANQTSLGVYTLTGITGTFDGVAITGLSSYANADNQLFFATQAYVDFSGISFQTATLGAINLFSNPGYFEVKSSVDGVGYYFNGTPISFAVSATPLPSTISLFVGGLAALGLLGWRQRRSRRAKFGSRAA
jgi:hypothetical protein